MTTDRHDKTAYTWSAVIFDLDGVITDTAAVHARAWKDMFDDYLETRNRRGGESQRPFDVETDYPRYVDGKPRYEGVADFLASRGISLAHGSPEDPPGKETICGLGNRKNRLFQDYLHRKGVKVYDDTVDLIQRLRAVGVKTAVVSSSKNCPAVLRTAGIVDLFDVQVNGIVSEELHLEGKPAPDIFLKAAGELGVDPERAVVVEDAPAGVEAGRAGGFGCVVGMDRRGQARRLKAHGADRTAVDAGELARVLRTPCRTTADLPSALNRWEDLAQALAGQTPVIFLDYDGTLTPIVERPEQAVLSEAMAGTLTRLADHCTVAVISGRDLKDVRKRVGIDSIYYAGSHGFEIAGPRRQRIKTEKGLEALPILDSAEDRVRNMLKDIPGAEVERKRFSIAVHYRRVADDQTEAVQQAVDHVLAAHSGLRKGHGKKVIELQPDVDWDKGKAVERLLEILSPDTAEAVLPIYIGDDVTDEDAFQALRGHGIGIVVHTGDPKPTNARYRLADPFQVRRFLGRLVEALEKGSR